MDSNKLMELALQKANAAYATDILTAKICLVIFIVTVLTAVGGLIAYSHRGDGYYDGEASVITSVVSGIVALMSGIVAWAAYSEAVAIKIAPMAWVLQRIAAAVN